MGHQPLPACLNAFPVQRLRITLVCCALFVGGSTFTPAQITVISSDNLTPFQPRDVGTTSDAKTVRIKLNYARAISSIAVAPGNTEFTAGSVSGCVVDGHTINPVFTACSLDVTFSPKYPGMRTAPLVMTDGAGIKSSVGLEGIGLAPRASLTPGIITTVAGDGTAGFSGDGGPATQAMLLGPVYVAFDREGNFYISDSINNRVRKVDRNGIITTVAGNGTSGFGGDGQATSAMLNDPFGLAVDAAGNLYIADIRNNRVRKVDRNGIISTFAGNGNNSGPLGDGGPATEATLSDPVDVAADTTGNLYIANAGTADSRIRKVDTQEIITTFAGNGNDGFSGDGGPATQAEFVGSVRSRARRRWECLSRGLFQLPHPSC